MARSPTGNHQYDNDDEADRRRPGRRSKIRRWLGVVTDLVQLTLQVQAVVDDEEPAPDGVRLLVLACKALHLLLSL